MIYEIGYATWKACEDCVHSPEATGGCNEWPPDIEIEDEYVSCLTFKDRKQAEREAAEDRETIPMFDEEGGS